MSLQQKDVEYCGTEVQSAWLGVGTEVQSAQLGVGTGTKLRKEADSLTTELRELRLEVELRVSKRREPCIWK